MGAGIAQSAALGGHDVLLHDAGGRTLRRALAAISRNLDAGVRRGKIDPARARQARRAFWLIDDLEQGASADIVIEAVDDDMAIKQAVFEALDDIVDDDTLLATSTDTLPVTTLAARTRRPERVVGLHFFNPAHIMQLVEVVRAEQTAPDVLDRALELVRSFGKTPLVVADTPGWVVNRVAQAYLGEALCLLDDGALEARTIDHLLEAAGFPMGPFRLIDFLGVETVFAVTRTMYEATFHAAPYRPHPHLQRLLDAGRGFYDEES